MELREKIRSYLAWPWTPWILILLAHGNFVGYRMAHYFNDRLTFCEWFEYDNLIISLLALIPLRFIWQKQQSDGVQTRVRLGYSVAVVVAAVHLFVNGLGLVGPRRCSSEPPRSGGFASMPMSAANVME